MDSNIITVVVIDDHAATTEGVRIWCESADPPIAVIDACGRLSDLWVPPGSDADVVIFDLMLRSTNPEYDQLRRLTQTGRKVVVYSQHTSRTVAVHCTRLGALAYLTKREGREHLIPAIRAAAAGAKYTSPDLAEAIRVAPGRPRLSEQEEAALLALFKYGRMPLAARAMGISTKTFHTYIERARQKYDELGRSAPTQIHLVRRGYEDGLLPPLDDTGGDDV